MCLTTPPVAGNPLISGKFHEQRNKHLHSGVDYAISVNTDIAASGNGKVVRASLLAHKS